MDNPQPMQNRDRNDQHHIPYRILSQADRPQSTESDWCWMHDFMRGFGYRDRNSDRYIFLRDTEHYLKIETNLFGMDLDKVYADLQPHLEEARERRRKYLEENPPKPITSFTIPKIRKPYPQLTNEMIVGKEKS